ncbi:MAG: glycosyltransferase family 4 protein, partial [Desulfobacterales bacterium]
TYLPYVRSKDGHIANWTRILRGILPASKLFRGLNIDLVHCNDRRINRTWAPWAKAAGLPMIWHQRTVWSGGRHMTFSLRFASGIISISNFVAQSIPAISIPHKTIYNPVSIESRNKEICARNLKQDLDCPDDTKLIGCFANAQRWKRPDTVFKAALLLNEQNTSRIKVVWCGDDRDGELSRLQKEHGHCCPVLKIPFKADVSSVMAGCDCVLAASEEEPFGRTLAEAMSLGVPVVASNAGGHCEIIDHEKNGLLFPVGDAGSCAAAIVRLLKKDGLRMNLISAGMATAKRFDPIQQAGQVYNFYNQLLGLDN